ncbi:SDR family NAD(P)-dependent oxidoreductase [Neoroseomonas soli]|uniref:SDR family oxidoreductase n=1 Tax=Neoroseomonas soli TaxID=1081025 RepID=A0A9X9WUH0_9PROT|nr:SDR family NAD(P)-dependent oxidoreductase [Neoroseomonas soli]MBR0670799.1 SDR family oxidoreductase [Neoroseomonas soli]
MKEYDFADVTVAVTGAGHGFGRAIAQSFAALGAQVYATDLSAEELEETADHPGAIHTSAFDLTAQGAAAAWIADVEKHAEGPVGVLVSNAGGVRGQVMRPVEQVPDADWHDIIAINLHAHFALAKAVAPGMKRAGHGRIVTISSGAGLQPSRTGIQAYTSAKHGLVGLTRQLAHELGPHGITVNSVAPGLILSNPSSIGQWEGYGPEGQARVISSIALRRLGEAQDIANAVMFLASPMANYVNGQVLSVDGGK